VQLFRVIHWDGHSLGRRGAGPLHVPRAHQGAGRHDAPDLYGAWYCTTTPVAAIAERIQPLRGQTLTDDDFRRLGQLTLSLVTLTIDPDVRLVDLDDPAQLLTRELRPSRVASRRRLVTQQMARRIYQEGAGGMLWWSTLSAEWINVTLFYERVMRAVSVVAPPRPLSTAMAEVRAAAEDLGVRIATRPIQ
jgi:hypothetical protein